MRKPHQPDTKLVTLAWSHIPKKIILRHSDAKDKRSIPDIPKTKQGLDYTEQPYWDGAGFVSHRPEICPLWGFRNSSGLPDLGSGLFGTSWSPFSICTAHLGWIWAVQDECISAETEMEMRAGSNAGYTEFSLLGSSLFTYSNRQTPNHQCFPVTNSLQT